MSRPSYGWVVVALWLSSTLAGFVIVFNIGILLPSIAEDLDLSPGQQGLLSSAAFWGNLALTLPLGWWTSRFSPKVVIASTLVFGTMLVFLQAWSPVFAVLLLGRLGFGVALLAMEPPGAALIHQWFPPHRIVFVNSVSNALFGIIMGLGLVATPLILTALGGEWRTTFYVSGAVMALLTVAWMLFGKDRRPIARPEALNAPNAPNTGDTGDTGGPGSAAEPDVPSTSVKATLMHRDLLLACVGMAGAVLAWSAFISFFPTLMLDRYDVSLKWAGGLLATNMAVGGLAGVAMAFVVAKSNRINAVLVVLGVTMTAGYAALTLTGSIPLLLVFAAFSGLSGAYFPLLYSAAFQLKGVTPDRIPVAVAAVMTAVSLGTVIGPLLTGFLQEAMGELRWPLIIAAGAGLLLLPVGALISLEPPGQEGENTPESLAPSGGFSDAAGAEVN